MCSKTVSRVGLIVSLCLPLLAGSAAMAQGVGNIGSLPVLIPMGSTNNWTVTDPNGGPLPVVLNPNGPVWHKDLAPPPGALINGGITYNLREVLMVAGNLPWSDYHEDIVTPGWSWSNPTLLVNGVVPAGYSVVNTPGNLVQGGSVDFFFNPIAPGSIVQISKDLIYGGPVPAFFPSISINQYPTPEPASMLLLAAGSVLLMNRRRRCLS